MGIDKNRFKCDIDEDLHICQLCNDVFDDPVIIIQKCQDSFCRKCLKQKLEEESKCPIEGCGEVIGNGDWTNNKTLEKLLSKLQLTCSFASNGCDQVIALSSLSTHTAECRHNPDNLTHACGDGCEASLNKQQVESHSCVLVLKEEINQLKGQLKQCQLEKEEIKSTVDCLEKVVNEYRTKTDELEKWLMTVNKKKDKYMTWLSKFPEIDNEDHRQKYIEVLKQKKLITDWKMEAVMRRCEAKFVKKVGGYERLNEVYATYFNWFVPTILSTLKDNLQFGSNFLYYGGWGYLTFACALMVGPNGRAFTDCNAEEKGEEYLGIKLAGEGIFNRIDIDFENKKLSQNDELINISFDCIFFRDSSFNGYRFDLFKSLLKPGGRMVKYKIDEYTSFDLIEKMSDGTVKQSVVNYYV